MLLVASVRSLSSSSNCLFKLSKWIRKFQDFIEMLTLLIIAAVAISYSESIPLSSSSMTYMKTGECKVDLLIL